MSTRWTSLISVGTAEQFLTMSRRDPEGAARAGVVGRALLRMPAAVKSQSATKVGNRRSSAVTGVGAGWQRRGAPLRDFFHRISLRVEEVLLQQSTTSSGSSMPGCRPIPERRTHASRRGWRRSCRSVCDDRTHRRPVATRPPCRAIDPVDGSPTCGRSLFWHRDCRRCLASTSVVSRGGGSARNTC